MCTPTAEFPLNDRHMLAHTASFTLHVDFIHPATKKAAALFCLSLHTFHCSSASS